MILYHHGRFLRVSDGALRWPPGSLPAPDTVGRPQPLPLPHVRVPRNWTATQALFCVITGPLHQRERNGSCTGRLLLHQPAHAPLAVNNCIKYFVKTFRQNDIIMSPAAHDGYESDDSDFYGTCASRREDLNINNTTQATNIQHQDSNSESMHSTQNYGHLNTSQRLHGHNVATTP